MTGLIRCPQRFGGTHNGPDAGAIWRSPPGKRGAFLLAQLVRLGGAQAIRVRRLGGSRSGEIRLTRLLRNPAVTAEEMVAEAGARTSARCQGREVLAIADTTVTRSDGGGGDYLHAVLAVDAQDGTILGLIEAQCLHRESGRKGGRRTAPIEEKESFRWLEGADAAASVCAGARAITVVADRESDIFEAFALRPDGVELLIRAAQDRCLAGTGSLFATLDALPEAGRAALELPARPGRKQRQAQLAVRFASLSLARPKSGPRAGLPAAVQVNVVDVREVNAPAGEQPVQWRLLTTRAVTTAADAWAVADLYRRRWAIEQLFRTLKTQGFDIEGLQIEDVTPRNKLITATVIAAVAIQQMVHAREGGPGPLRPHTDVFEADDLPMIEAYCAQLEGKTERQKNPHPKGSLAYAGWVCARLGGWTGYYGKPGPVVMLRGWLELQTAKRALALLMPGHNV